MRDPEDTLALAHALRTPLTSLALGLGLLDDEALGPLTERQREVVRTLVADVARLSLLVDRELRTERLGAHAGPIELLRTGAAELVESARAPLVDQAEERGVVISSEVPEGVEIVVDPVKMRWVIASLVGNALRFAPRGTTVLVRAEVVAGCLELSISDEGPGVAEDVAARLFERGGGVGLYLAREIVEAHGGTIRVESQPLRGCAFFIRLPAT